RAAGEHVPASTAFPNARRRAAHRDCGAPRTGVAMLAALLDLLDPAADPDSVARPEPGDTARLPRATCHGGPQEERSNGRIPRASSIASGRGGPASNVGLAKGTISTLVDSTPVFGVSGYGSPTDILMPTRTSVFPSFARALPSAVLT